MKKREDPRIQVLREALIRDGITASRERSDHLDWLHENGYFETFTDANGTQCYRVTEKGIEALESDGLQET